MVVLLVLVTGIVWVYTLLSSSQKLADSTGMRIEAIQIARDWLEAMTNIRDTNWIKYPLDYENCWNTRNYDIDCIGDTSTDHDMTHSANQGIIVYKNTDNQFITDVRTNSWNNFASWSYRDDFAIRKDVNWFYTQSGGTIYGNGTTPFYTREIRLDYLDDSSTSQWSSNSNNQRVRINAIVQWIDTSKNTPQRLEMSSILTNWKAKK